METLKVVDAMGLAAAYTAASYGVRMDSGHFDLRIGQPASDLENRLPASSYAFITAWNPASYPRHDDANLAADSLLTARIDALGFDRVPAWGEGPNGQWRESGWLLTGVDDTTINQLGLAFGQAAILAWNAGEPVALRMLMPDPRTNNANGAGIGAQPPAELAASVHWLDDRRDADANA